MISRSQNKSPRERPLGGVLVSGVSVRTSRLIRRISQPIDFVWRPQPDLNRCCRRERPVSWTRLDDGDEHKSSMVGRARLERATLCLKGRYSTG